MSTKPRKDDDDANDNMQCQSTTPTQYACDENGNYIKHIKGLEYFPNFLSKDEQTELINLIYSNRWQEGVIHRRQQFYGEIYYHTTFKSKILQGCYDNGANGDKEMKEDILYKPIDMDKSGMRKWLLKCMPFFEVEGLYEQPTQVLINEYKNNMGISSHFEDFEAFGPLICTISLINPTYMTLKRPVERTNQCEVYTDVVKVLLEPGSLLIMKHDARNEYRHGIGKFKWVTIRSPPDSRSNEEQFDGECGAEDKKVMRIKRDDNYRRVSVTIRHLLDTRRQVKEDEDESNTIKDPNLY